VRTLIAPVVGVVVALATLAAQTPVFRGRVDLIPLDVSVFDQDHHPVKGLSVDHFTLLEDDKPRPVVTFSEVNMPDPSPPTAAWMRDAATDVATNDVRDRRLVLLVIDDANLGGAVMFGKMRDMWTDTARTVINHLTSSDLAAVVFTGDNRRSQGFTTDHARLLTAVDHMTAPSMDARLKARYTVDILRRATEAFIGVPGRRKALVYITDFEIPMVAIGGNGELDLLVAETKQVFEIAQRAGVNVYTMKFGNTPWGNWEASWSLRVAHETGGEAFARVGEPGAAEEAVTRIFEANSSYYILGYSSADMEKFHFIRVTVDVPGLEVRTRDKYYWPEKEKADTGPPPPATVKAMAGILPAADVPMRATVAPFATPGGSGATVAVIARVHLTPPPGKTGPSTEKIDLRTGIFTTEGDARGSSTSQTMVRHTGAGELDSDVMGPVAIAKPGLYELRVSAHRETADISGSVYLTVDVPDFAKLPVSLSGAVLSTDAWPPFGPKDPLSRVVPVVPTSVREFGAGDRVKAFVRVYEGGKGPGVPVAFTTRIVDDHDRVVLDRPETIAAARFGTTRNADVRLDLPTRTLAPGAYLLTFEVVLDKTTARREVRFSVK
jgi:VWFA-related protein